MDNRQPLDPRAYVLMLSLCLIWSLQQVLLKATADAIAPTLQIALRSGAGAVLVWLFMRWRRMRVTWADSWRPGLFVGALFALEFLLLGEAINHTSASHVVVFLYSAPVFAALGLHCSLASERLARLQWLGIGLAFAGIALAFLGGGQGGGVSLKGDLLALGAGAAWGATTVAVRTSRLAGLPAAQTLLYQLATGFALLMPAAMLLGQTRFEPTPLAWASLAFNAVLVCFVSFLIWFWLLTQYLASRLGVFSFLTPILGVILGAWLLSEPLASSFVFGAFMVLAGVLLVSGHGWLASLIRRS
ncbi:DMT family transporter [Comamonas composti]|uniref:DMT family transporter n=1 Tax=Comamonas composti TaxID=408558 RepID=UPI0004125224|nr:DMT family transporter [Comamonas composti]